MGRTEKVLQDTGFARQVSLLKIVRINGWLFEQNCAVCTQISAGSVIQS